MKLVLEGEEEPDIEEDILGDEHCKRLAIGVGIFCAFKSNS